MKSQTNTRRQLECWTEQTLGQDVLIAPEQCASRNVLRLYEYWLSLRRGRSMPARVDIDPTQIWSLLPNIHISEWHRNPDRVRYRLAGTELVAAIGIEIGGKWLTDFHVDPVDVRQTMELYYRVIAARAPIFGRTVETEVRAGVECFEWILCPLSDDGGDITHFIGLEDYVAKHRYLGAGV